MTQRNFQGAKYDRNLTANDITKLIRKDLKAEFPTYKFSVVKDTYAGGWSVIINIKKVDFEIIAPRPDDYEKASVLLNRVKEIANAYNYDDSDVMSDYFNVNYYTHVDFDI